MKWPWTKRGDQMGSRQVPAKGDQQPTSLDEARAARRTSEQGLAHARQRDPTVRRVAGSLRTHRDENHFAEMLETIFKEPT